MKAKNIFLGLIPVLFGFFVMGFVDVVGIASSYVQADLGLTEQMSGIISFVAFLWFLLLSVPTASLMNKIGRKNTVLISMIVTVVGMLIPYVSYTLTTCIIAFAMLGIGNTILQVSLNPLVSNVVSGKALTSTLTGGQVVKAVSSFCGPFIALFAANQLGSWQNIFTIYAAITLLSGLWLAVSPIKKEEAQQGAGMGATFALLKDRTILLLFLGIVAVVGVDVGLNTVSTKLLIQVLGLDPSNLEAVKQAGYAPSVYFACRTIGAFVGTWLLLKIAPLKYFRISIIVCLLGMAFMFFANSEATVLTSIGIVGFAASSIFSVIFGMALQARPDKANEISGLMITGVFGGAVIPPLMTWAAGTMNNQIGALIVLSIAVIYLTFCAFGIKTNKQ